MQHLETPSHAKVKRLSTKMLAEIPLHCTGDCLSGPGVIDCLSGPGIVVHLSGT